MTKITLRNVQPAKTWTNWCSNIITSDNLFYICNTYLWYQKFFLSISQGSDQTVQVHLLILVSVQCMCHVVGFALCARQVELPRKNVSVVPSKHSKEPKNPGASPSPMELTVAPKLKTNRLLQMGIFTA